MSSSAAAWSGSVSFASACRPAEPFPFPFLPFPADLHPFLFGAALLLDGAVGMDASFSSSSSESTAAGPW